MPIEISNQITLGQTPNPGEETTTGQAQNRASQSEAETGRAVDTTIKISDGAERLQQLTESIAQLPAVEPEKVEAAQTEIRNGELGILSKDIKQKLASAEEIAAKILAFDTDLPKASRSDAV